MIKRFPDPKFLQGNGTQYKSRMEEGNVFTTLYDVMVPKMNIQGNQKSIRKFVIDVLPEVYKAVSEASRIETQKSSILPLNTRVRLSAEITYSCDVCDKKYVRKPPLRKHIQVKHASSVEQPKKIMYTTQPIPIPSISTDRVSEENHDDLQEINEDDSVQITMEEIAEVVEEIRPQQEDTNWQCSKCGDIASTENQLTEHMSQIHEDISLECNECGKIFIEERQLTVHITDVHRNRAPNANNIVETKSSLI